MPSSDDPAFTVETGPDGQVLRFVGGLVVASLGALERPLARFRPEARAVRLDVSEVERMDTAGAFVVDALARRLEAEGVAVEIVPGAEARADLFATVRRSRPEAEGEEEPPSGFLPWLRDVGEETVRMLGVLAGLLGFFGLTLATIGRTALRPRRLRAAALVHQMQETGFNAVPIVSLMGFLIGVVLAFQGSVQLRQFGAEVFVVDLIAISILRELGIMLTAIIVAGRSGSAFTASIGSMKVREEIDAMRTLGLDPMEVLVLPRVLALAIMLPILGFVANVMGLLGGALMSWVELGISPAMFLTRLQDNTDVWHLGVGMIKAPVFAVVIATVACWQGFQVGGSSESVGQRTTAAVVQAIFLVIAIDALFSVFFAEIGV
ncbi:MAG TPA: MlaE family lipid ABC transporter permease subunit [Paracoccaceae bacterium]|nr:MlaE family lipid ABC transporter permease subunit [Paracoccaceae bacterium]